MTLLGKNRNNSLSGGSSLRIGIATSEYPVDTVGGGIYSTIVAEKLAELGEEVHVFSGITSEYRREEPKDGFFVHEIPMVPKPFSLLSYYPFLLPKIRRVVDSVGRLDILHSMGTCCFGLPTRSRLWKLNVCTLHHLSKCTIEELRPNILRRLKGFGTEIGIMQLFEKRIIEWSDVILSVSEYTKHSIVRMYGKPQGSIEVIPNAVPPEMLELSRVSPENYGGRLTPEDCHNILHVGRVYYRKRIDFLLKAFALFRSQENAKLWVVGPGNLEKYRRLAERLGISEDVTFTGVVSRISLAKFYKECDVFALTSACEGFGLVLIEAMMNGLPVIACSNTAIPEVIGPDGILVDSDDIDSFAEEMVSLLRDKGRRRLLSEAGRKRVKRKYSDWTAMTEKIRDTYSKHLEL